MKKFPTSRERIFAEAVEAQAQHQANWEESTNRMARISAIGLLGSAHRAQYDNGVPFETLTPEQRITRLKSMYAKGEIDEVELENGVGAALQLKETP